MRRPLLIVTVGVLLGLGIIRYSAVHYALAKAEVVNSVGFLFLLASVTLLYYQIKSSLSYECRRTTHEFMHGPVLHELLPLEKELKGLLHIQTTIFEKDTTIKAIQSNPKFAEIQTILLDILNFYERMAISLQRHVFDEEMLFDDKGAVFLSLHDWVRPLIENLQKQHEPRAYANLVAIAARWRERYNKEEARQKQFEGRRIKSLALPKRDSFS